VSVLGFGAADPAPDGLAAEHWVSVPAPADGEAESMLAWLREPEGHPSDRWHTEAAVAAIRAVAERDRPRLAVVETLVLHRYLPLLRELGMTVVLNAHNIEGPLHDELAGERPDVLSRAFVGRLHALERRAFAAVDQVWVCSEADRRAAAARYPGHAPLHVVPNTIDVAAYAGPRSPAPEPSVLFVGTLGYPPNERAALRLVTEIHPALVRRDPRTRLTIVGGDPSPALIAAVDRAAGRVELTGQVADVRPYLRRAWTAVVPLAEGGGTRLKILEALAAGVPVVSTAKGAEGLDLRPGREFVLADGDEAIAAAVGALLEDPAQRDRLARAGRVRVAERYDVAAAERGIADALRAFTPA
jgi:glycosyltransferase involved in cell wall biosynthesis